MSSHIINETDDYIELYKYIHDRDDEYSDWELDEAGDYRYSSEVHEGEHFAFYEVRCTYRIDKKTGIVTYLKWE